MPTLVVAAARRAGGTVNHLRQSTFGRNTGGGSAVTTAARKVQTNAPVLVMTMGRASVLPADPIGFTPASAVHKCALTLTSATSAYIDFGSINGAGSMTSVFDVISLNRSSACA